GGNVPDPIRWHDGGVFASRLVHQECAANQVEEVVDVTICSQAERHAEGVHFGQGREPAADLAVGERHGRDTHPAPRQQFDLKGTDLHTLGSHRARTQHAERVVVFQGTHAESVQTVRWLVLTLRTV